MLRKIKVSIQTLHDSVSLYGESEKIGGSIVRFLFDYFSKRVPVQKIVYPGLNLEPLPTKILDSILKSTRLRF